MILSASRSILHFQWCFSLLLSWTNSVIYTIVEPT
jgi:hypothetical protein